MGEHSKTALTSNIISKLNSLRTVAHLVTSMPNLLAAVCW